MARGARLAALARVPRTVRLAAIGLAIIMVGALVMHAIEIPGGLADGAFTDALLLALVVILLLRRGWSSG